ASAVRRRDERLHPRRDSVGRARSVHNASGVRGISSQGANARTFPEAAGAAWRICRRPWSRSRSGWVKAEDHPVPLPVLALDTTRSVLRQTALSVAFSWRTHCLCWDNQRRIRRLTVGMPVMRVDRRTLIIGAATMVAVRTTESA